MVWKIARIAAPVWFVVTVMAVSAEDVAAAAPEDNFQWYCAQCHGDKGAGDGVNSTVKELPVGPMNLSVAKEIRKFSDADILKTLTHGGPVNRLEPLMPPWGNRLTRVEIREMVGYVRSLCKGDDCPPK